jgi:hypothetical protein
MIHVIGRHVANGLVQPLMVVVVHEASDSSLELPGAVVVLEPDPVLHRAVVALDLALRHRVVGAAPGVPHLMLF